MPVDPPRLLAVLTVVAAVSGCASAPVTGSYHPLSGAEQERYWPSPPEVPRYRYAGELVGEANFGRGAERGTAERFLRWVVGLGRGSLRRPDNLERPQSGLVDALDRILVTDAGRRAVFVFDMAAGKLEVWDRADRNQPFDAPAGIAQGQEGELLVADAGLGRVVRLSTSGKPLGSFGEQVLERPAGIAVRGAKVYVADAATHTVRIFDLAGGSLGVIGDRGTQPGMFNGPTHLSTHGGELYVSDSLNARVQVFDAQDTPVRTVGRRGLYVGNLTRPKGVTVDSDGNVYVVESYYDHLVIFDRDGRYLLPIGGTGSEIGRFFLPSGVWSDGQDRIFVADMYNARVVVLQYLGD